jgi:hypothetical protein
MCFPINKIKQIISNSKILNTNKMHYSTLYNFPVFHSNDLCYVSHTGDISSKNILHGNSLK